ncbi:BRCT domain [Dillenia turbinata]|uniref:DNA ligase n=1 Tax=Dillenia turbinata TaxID=194707 RepID=A0AAN8WAA1_9MAGN
MSDETKFSVLVSLFNWMQKSKSSAKKRSKFRKFLDTFYRNGDYFSAIRLILPALDRERGIYGLKESVLATCLVDALGMSKDSEDAVRLFNWRKGGPRSGANAGNFALVASEVLQRRQGMASGGLTIKELNALLDRLASGECRAEKTLVLSDLIKKTNAQEMKWIIMIILKDLKLGVSERSIFHEFHPDAEDLFNVTCDLKLVCDKLRDRRQRHKRQDIEVGKPVRPQLAMRVRDATAAWKKLQGKDVVVECKFDGDRIQIHKNGTEINFFSRNFLDHPEYEHGMSEVIMQNILVDRCILDGEMLVWNTSTNRFAEFGSNQEIAKAAREGLENVAFDILYAGDTSVIHQSLKERHELLRKVVKPLKGRLEILLPNGGLNAHCPSGEPPCSMIAQSVDDVESFFKQIIENRDEGIVLKDLGSKWEPSDRSGKWLKLKPEYIQAGSDLDVLIIGGYFGSGRHGGEVAQFLVGLAERAAPNTYPRRFVSFCRVGTGLSDEELDAVVTKLKPYFRKNEYPKKSPPSFYQVTNNSKERPDVWIDSPEKSIILSITSDIRTIRSEVFAAPYSLRFPPFVELVHSSNGTTHKGTGTEAPQESKPKRIRLSRGAKSSVSVVPSHFIQTDVSNVKEESLIFSNMMFYFVNVPLTYSLDTLHKLVVENGGNFSMNLNNSVTHCIAAERIRYQAAKLRGDVINYSWVLNCCSQKKLLNLQPKYFLSLSDASKRRMQEDIDEFSDSYYLDLDMHDIKQKKYCPRDEWCRFHGCRMYFYLLLQPLRSTDYEVLLKITMRRMKLEVSKGGGEVSDDLSHATHLVVFSVPGFGVNFDTLLNSFSEAEKHALSNRRLHVVGSQWLKDSFEKEEKLQEKSYSLKPEVFEELFSEERKAAEEEAPSRLVIAVQVAPTLEKEQKKGSARAASRNSITLALTRGDGQRKRGRPASMSTRRGRDNVKRARKTRAMAGNKRAKIWENDSDRSATDEMNDDKDETIEDYNHATSVGKTGQETNDIKSVEDSEASETGEIIKQNFEDDIKQGECSDKAHNIVESGSNDQCLEIEKTPEKLRVMEDPVQAMLLDMIPSLGMKKIEGTSQKPPVDPDTAPKTKKKVSYKDVVGDLLKDW